MFKTTSMVVNLYDFMQKIVEGLLELYMLQMGNLKKGR
jgi:hypothetical protein